MVLIVGMSLLCIASCDATNNKAQKKRRVWERERIGEADAVLVLALLLKQITWMPCLFPGSSLMKHRQW